MATLAGATLATQVLVGSTALAAATGVAGHFEQKKAGRKAARAQKKANATSQASAQIENARQRRRAIAQSRIAQAQNQAQQNEQVQTSSPLSGVQAGISTQLGANIGAQRQRIGAQQTIQDFQQQSADALREGRDRAGMWNAVGNISQTTGNAAGSFVQ